MDHTVHTGAGHEPPSTDAAGDAECVNDLHLLAPVAHVVLDLDATILQMNLAAAELFGLCRSQPGRVSLRQFVASRFHDDFSRFLQRAINSSELERCDLQLVTGQNQQGIPVTLRASADCSGQALCVAVEPAQGMLAALERSEQRLRRIVHSAEEGIWEIDAAACTSFVNPRMAQMLGYTVEEMLAQPLRHFMDEEGRGLLEHNLARRRQGQAERHEFKFLRKDGRELWAMLTTNPILDSDGAYCGALALVSDITDSRASAEQIWQQANFDALTALPNRHMFEDRLGQEMKKARRDGMLLALLFIDLDGFKAVNDTLGHQQGDQLLAEAARRISACVRNSDTVARLGGDEFTVILAGLERAHGIDRIAESVLAQLQQRYALAGGQALVSASIGIALYPADAATADALLHCADQAMYAAKHGGRNRYSYYTPELQQAAQARQRVALDLRAALAAQQFELHYQPIVNLQSGRIERAEALLRWRHPERGLLTPAEFLPFAEAGGMMLEIGDWVFRRAIEQARCWQDELGCGFQVSVNQSPAELRGDTALYADWLRHAAQLGLAPRNIALEIAEGVLLDGMARVSERLRDLREMGLQVALDNFGTGHASLSHLRHCGIDLLKLDHSFIRDVAHDSGDQAMCEALIAMAHKLGLRVVAEGVETAAQRGLLAQAGCDYGQGYVFAGAMPAAELTALARRGLASAG